MRLPLPPLLAAVLWVAPAAAGAQSRAPRDHVEFVANIEEAKAHLLISRELYAAGQASRAALHSSHPVQELGNRIIGPIAKADAALGERVRALVREPRRAIDGKAPAHRYGALITDISRALDEAVDRVVPKEVLASAAFQAGVIGRILDAVVEEYDEAWKAGMIVQVVDYQDACGMYRRVQDRVKKLPPGVARSAAADLATLGKAFPGLSPPPSPVGADRIRQLAVRISAALKSAAAR